MPHFGQRTSILGLSGVLFVALAAGHYRLAIPDGVGQLGLALFVYCVGLSAGNRFFSAIAKQGSKLAIMSAVIVGVSALFTCLFGIWFKVPAGISSGIFAGACTSTPALAAATESLPGASGSGVSIGYGIAYPFGVVGVVLFVQLFPKFVKCNIEEATKKLHDSLHDADIGDAEEGSGDALTDSNRFKLLEPFGILPIAFVTVFGIMLGLLEIPLPGGMSFSLGTAGGPLFIGLIIGHFGHIGKLSLTSPSGTLKVMRELGLVLFLLGAGTEAGAGFIEVLQEQGVKLFLLGVVITLLPMLLACLLAKLAFKLDTLTTLGSVCGGMTSTPALGALISLCGSEDVAASYAATYPFALVCMVLGAQLMAILW